uniref:Uncharacterized protein n=1 Tax=Arundo donax TaxID=35708 RepID=A0A0A9HET2_ARUDO
MPIVLCGGRCGEWHKDVSSTEVQQVTDLPPAAILPPTRLTDTKSTLPSTGYSRPCAPTDLALDGGGSECGPGGVGDWGAGTGEGGCTQEGNGGGTGAPRCS